MDARVGTAGRFGWVTQEKPDCYPGDGGLDTHAVWHWLPISAKHPASGFYEHDQHDDHALSADWRDCWHPHGRPLAASRA